MVRVIRLAPVWGFALFGLAFTGRGYLNGDIAAYCAQAWVSDVSDRVVHLGYLVVATGLAPLAGEALPRCLDVANVLAAALASVAAARLAPRASLGVGLAAGGLLLPWSPFAEVDVPWIAAVLAAATGLPGAIAVGVALSPTALLATPWVAWHRGQVTPLLEAVVAVVALTLLTNGDWWWGPRGVLEPRSYLIGRNFGGWVATVPWLVILTGHPLRIFRPLLALAPLLLAPADVPAAALVGVVVTAAALDAPGGPLRGLALALGLALGLQGAQLRAERVDAEQAAIVELLERFEPGDGLVAPFTWGARASVIATGDPYGLPWHPPGRFLRDQEVQWRDVHGTIWVLPPPGGATSAQDPGEHVR